MQWETFLQAVHRKLRSDGKRRVYGERTEGEIISVISVDRDTVDLISSWLESCVKESPKSAEKARNLKNQGNEHFKGKDYVKSLGSYTESARFSPGGGEDFPVAIANRSAALFHMCRYEDCLRDIEVAVEAGYPRKLMHKVHLRAAHCYVKLRNVQLAKEEISKAEKLISEDQTISSNVRENLLRQIALLTLDVEKTPGSSGSAKNDVVTPEVLMEKNENYPSASSALTRDFSPTRRRFVVAAKPVKKGDILFVEKPYAFVPLDHENSNVVCANCCGEFLDAAFPCRGCTEISYCSPKCWRESWVQYHRWECSGYEMGIWRQIGIAHLALKVLLVSVTNEDVGKFNEMQKLVTNIDKLGEDDLMIYSITALMLSHYLDDYTDFLKSVDLQKNLINKFTSGDHRLDFNITTISNKKKFLCCLLLRHMLQLIANGHAITRLNLINTKKVNIVDEQQQRVAVGIYPSVSMMNHACDPTIMNTFWNDYLIVKATKDVPVGGEIFNCYGPHFRRMPVEERQRALKSQYCFECKCPSCTDPSLQCFLDRFSALKCPSCTGPLKATDKDCKCLDCHEIMKIDVERRNKELKIAQELFIASESCLEMGKFEEANKKLLKCLNIRKNLLFRHHEDVAITLDSLGKVSVIMGQLLNSISYLEESITTVEEKFGSDSIEVANELNKITDVCIQYLQKEMNRRSDIYKDTLRKTRSFLDRAEEITSLISGPWNSVCRELKEKKEELEGMFESCHI